MKIKAVIFDMDGLLLDTESLFISESRKIFEDLGCEIPDEVYLECAGTRNAGTKAILQDRLGPDLPLEAWERQIQSRVNNRIHTGGVKKKKGVDRILRALQAKDISLAVASSSERKDVEELLTLSGLIDNFKNIICGDEVENTKPNPEIFLKTAGALDESPGSCMVFEDSFHGIRAAHTAGMRPVMIPDLRSPGMDIIQLCFRICPSLDYAAEILDELLV